MKRQEPVCRGSGQSPVDPALLDRPLDFIIEDHLREREVCAVIDALASAAALDRQAALTVLRFVNEELNVHLRDEAEDLFPLLAERCTTEDAIETAITRIRIDQEQAMCLLPAIRTALSTCLDTGVDLSTKDRKLLISFAGHVRRHLVAENAIVLPIARARLSRSDLEVLSRRMRARRGLPPLAETTDAE